MPNSIDIGRKKGTENDMDINTMENISENIDEPELNDDQNEALSAKMKCIRETLRICKKKGYLTDYINNNEESMISAMLATMEDEERLARYAMEKAQAEDIDIGTAEQTDRRR